MSNTKQTLVTAVLAVVSVAAILAGAFLMGQQRVGPQPPVTGAIAPSERDLARESSHVATSRPVTYRGAALVMRSREQRLRHYTEQPGSRTGPVRATIQSETRVLRNPRATDLQKRGAIINLMDMRLEEALAPVADAVANGNGYLVQESLILRLIYSPGVSAIRIAAAVAQSPRATLQQKTLAVMTLGRLASGWYPTPFGGGPPRKRKPLTRLQKEFIASTLRAIADAQSGTALGARAAKTLRGIGQ